MVSYLLLLRYCKLLMCKNEQILHVMSTNKTFRCQLNSSSLWNDVQLCVIMAELASSSFSLARYYIWTSFLFNTTCILMTKKILNILTTSKFHLILPNFNLHETFTRKRKQSVRLFVTVLEEPWLLYIFE